MKSLFIARISIGIAAIAAAALLFSASCSSSPCILEDGCHFNCEDDDFCDDDRFGETPLACHEVYDGFERERICTRPCSSSADCSCGCDASPDAGFCLPGPKREYDSSRPEDIVTCRADAPTFEVMCDKLLWGRFSCCTVSGSDIEACTKYRQQYPACEKELFEFFLCSYRSENLCVGEGVYAPGECADQVTTLEACAGVTWNVFRLDGC